MRGLGRPLRNMLVHEIVDQITERRSSARCPLLFERVLAIADAVEMITSPPAYLIEREAGADDITYHHQLLLTAIPVGQNERLLAARIDANAKALHRAVAAVPAHIAALAIILILLPLGKVIRDRVRARKSKAA